jgi:hypothetical protein
LTRRDPREVIDPLIAMLRNSLKYVERPGGGPGGLGVLFIEGDRFNVRRIYVPESGNRTSARGDSDERDERRDPARAAQDRLNTDIAAINRHNGQVNLFNSYIREALHAYTGQEFGVDPDAWRAWWADQQGYAYTPQTSTTRRTVTVRVRVPFSTSCFVAGTPVQALSGARPIESLRVGDRVLAQDIRDGRLSYQPIVAIYHTPSSPTVRIRLENEEIVATPIHRFWKAGHGWATARDLHAGDVIRTAGGTARVQSIEADRVQPVFNLEVAGANTFFVGTVALLVHDHSLADPVTAPFDAIAQLAGGRGQ